MATEKETIELPIDLYERLLTVAQAENIDIVTLLENLLGSHKPATKPIDDFDPSQSPLYRLHEHAIDTGIPDLAQNLDHYLYGLPKVEEE